VIKIEKVDVVDVVIATDEGILLIKRKYPIKPIKKEYPTYENCWALIGGHVDPGETDKKAAIREAYEETHLKVKIIKKIGDYDKPSPRQKSQGLTLRDPRGNYVSHAYLAEIVGGELRADSDAKELKFFKKIPENIAFDHDEIVSYGLNKIRKDFVNVIINFNLLPEVFTLKMLQNYYEIIQDVKFEKQKFIQYIFAADILELASTKIDSINYEDQLYKFNKILILSNLFLKGCFCIVFWLMALNKKL